MRAQLVAVEDRMDRDFALVRADIADLRTQWSAGLREVHGRVDDLQTDFAAAMERQSQRVERTVADTIANHERDEIVRYEQKFGVVTQAIGTLTAQVAQVAASSDARSRTLADVADTIDTARKFVLWALAAAVTTGAAFVVWIIQFVLTYADKIARILDNLGGM